MSGINTSILYYHTTKLQYDILIIPDISIQSLLMNMKL